MSQNYEEVLKEDYVREVVLSENYLILAVLTCHKRGLQGFDLGGPPRVHQIVWTII